MQACLIAGMSVFLLIILKMSLSKCQNLISTFLNGESYNKREEGGMLRKEMRC